MIPECDILLIFSGYNQRAVISFLRTLEKRNIDNWGIVASSPDDTIFLTTYSRYVVYTRKNEDLSVEEMKKIIATLRADRNVNSFLVAPSTEYLNRFMLKNREVLEKLKCFIPLVKQELYEKISDKETFKALCSEYGISIPEQIMCPVEFHEPFVAKPKRYFSRSGKVCTPFLIESKEIYDVFCSNCDKEDFLYEEFLEGESYYLLYYFSQNNSVLKLSQENLMQQPNGKSILCARTSNIHEQYISKQFERMFTELQFKGLVMVEVRYCNGSYYMIEANPRFWGPSQLFCDAGLNFFEYFLLDNRFISSINDQKGKETMYFWGGGYMQTLSEGRMPKYFRLEEKQFCDDILKWVKWDIYNREDTWKLFVRGL